MAAESAIEWTDATVNFWWGCTKVGPGCDHCYAETHSNRFEPGHWGTGAPRRKIKGAAKLLNRLDNDYAWWAADAQIGRYHPNSRRRVFIQSMSDLFDLEVPLEWFAEAWGKIVQCDRVDIQIVTKRISAVEKRLAAIGVTSWPKHAGLLVTVVNQAEANRDIPRLLALKAKLSIPWVGVSAEPLLGPIDFTALDINADGEMDALNPAAWLDQIEMWRGSSDTWEEDFLDWFNLASMPTGGNMHPVLDWIIVGGESGPNARPMHPEWAQSIRDQCAAAETPFFFKQWGEWCPISHMNEEQQETCYFPAPLNRPEASRRERKPNCVLHSDGKRFDGRDRFGREAFLHGTGAMTMFAIGKKAAGRLLDGVKHDGMPKAFR